MIDKTYIPFHIEDNEGNHSYDGMLEGGQTSNYSLLVFEVWERDAERERESR